MTGNLFSQVVPLLVAMAIPVPMIKNIRYLLAGRPVAHSLLMILTWGATFFLVLSLSVSLKSFLIEISEIHFTYQPSKDFSSWMHLVMGLLFIAIGVLKLRQSLRQESEPVVQKSVPVTASSIIKATIHAAFLSKNNFMMMLYIMFILVKSEIALEHSLAVSGLIAFTSMIWISLPLFVYLLAGHDRDRVLELLKQWLMQNKETLIIFIFLFIGISTLSTAIGGLIPEMLEWLLVDVIE